MGYKRKYQKGKQITSLDELYDQEFIYCFGKIMHRGWFRSWQMQLAIHYLDRGVIYYAVKEGEEK